ncbi:MAG: diguanylate cyclase [Thermomicrobiales bacterium]
MALLIIDLDHFKDINDTFGHLAGDTLLREIAIRLRTRLRRSDFPARYAGDELAVILPETGLVGAMALAERLRSASAATPLHTGEARPAWLTLSVGVAIYTPGTTVTDFLRAADSALYFAKHEGRNRVRGPDAAQAALSGPTDELATILRGGNQAVIEESWRRRSMRAWRNRPGRPRRWRRSRSRWVRRWGWRRMNSIRCGARRWSTTSARSRSRPTSSGDRGRSAGGNWCAPPAPQLRPARGRPGLPGALPQILHHHERWDGGGYPMGSPVGRFLRRADHRHGRRLGGADDRPAAPRRARRARGPGRDRARRGHAVRSDSGGGAAARGRARRGAT